MKNLDMLLTLLILAGSVITLAGNFMRGDLVGVLIILSLVICGILDVSEALSGFSSSAVVLIAAMFIVGKAITHTGIAHRVGEAIIRYGHASETRLLVMLMAAAGLVGAFMSSTATVAIFMPIALSVAEKANVHHKRLLMPLAVASLISGMMTLVATTPNIIVNDALRKQGLAAFSLFSFTPFGILTLLLAIVFMASLGQSLLAAKGSKAERKKEPSIDDLLQYHRVAKYEFYVRVPAHSELVDQNVASMQLGARYQVTLLAVEAPSRRHAKRIVPARPEVVFHHGDLLLLIGSPDHVQAFAEDFSLEIIPSSPAKRKAFFREVGIAEVMLNPESSLIGKSLRETLFQTMYHSIALGVRRKGETLTDNIADLPLSFGDILLVCGAWEDILRLGQNRDQYLLLTLPQDRKGYIPAKNKESLALCILMGMMGFMAWNILPAAAIVLATAAALVFTRCVPRASIYDVIDWPTIVMTAGVLPLALAMQKTGISAEVSSVFLKISSASSPYLVLAGLFIVASCMGFMLSNTAVAILLAPMAIEAGLALHISPQACAMTVAIACSASFASPFGSPVNTIVREPGGYSFKDYARVGFPLLGISLLLTLLLCRFLYL